LSKPTRRRKKRAHMACSSSLVRDVVGIGIVIMTVSDARNKKFTPKQFADYQHSSRS
jgi:hypothetical protein